MTDPAGASDQPAAQINPDSLLWRIALATKTHRFFGLIHDAEVAKLISQPQDAGTAGPWPVAYFSLYLQQTKFPAGGSMSEVSRILIEMERVGLLLRCGWRSDLTNAGCDGAKRCATTRFKLAFGVYRTRIDEESVANYEKLCRTRRRAGARR